MTDAQRTVQGRLLAYHRGDWVASEGELDRMLGLAARAPDGAVFEDAELDRRHPGESFADLPTPYPILRGLFEALALGEHDHFVDLGCGNGRVVLYGGLTTTARFTGVEIVEERADAAQAAATALGLTHVAVLGASALDHDLSTGTVFYLFRPFGERTEPLVLSRLHDEARRRAITVVTHRLPPGRIDPEVLAPIATGTLGIHRSVPR